MRNTYWKSTSRKMLYGTLLAGLTTLFCITAQAQVSLTATSGATFASYSTLKQAIDSINTGYHQGDIEIKVHSNVTETAAIGLDSSGAVAGAVYTSIHILPADTATVAKVISANLDLSNMFLFRGADHVTIDGRPLSTGSAHFLTFQNLGDTTGSNVFSLTNGSSFNTFRYLNVLCNTRLYSSIGFFLGGSAVVSANTNDTIEYCNVSNALAGIYTNGTVANPMDNIIVRNNNVFDCGLDGIYFGGVKNFTCHANNIYHTMIASSTNPIGIELAINCSGYNGMVTSNKVYDLRTSGIAGIFGIYCNATLAAPAITPVVNCFNNTVSLTQNSGSTTGVIGLNFLGTGRAILRFIHNSIWVGGTHTGGTAGFILSQGAVKSNSSTTSTFIFRNNVLLNSRTGGTTGAFHTAFRLGSTTGTLDMDYNLYWASGGAGNGPFPATWGTTLYAQANAGGYRSAAATFNPVLEVNSIFNAITYTSTTNLEVNGTLVNNLAVMGCTPTSFVSTDINGALRGATPYKGAYETTPFTAFTDVSVKEVYSLGKLPVPYANPHQVRANIKYFGTDTLFNLPVTLQISGNNSFSDIQIVDTVIPFSSRYISFTGYSYPSTGAGTVTVSVPADDVTTNDSKTFNQIVTTGSYAYADPTLAPDGGVGFTGASGDFIAKFPYTGTNAINQVGVNFSAGAQPYQIVVFSVVNDTPGVLLYTSASQTSVTGFNTVAISPALPVTGSFFVGVRQTGIVNVSFGFQNEDPIRNQTFFYKATGAARWLDFASNNSTFRFMVEPRLQVADDIGISDVEQPCAVVMTAGAAIAPQYKVTNYGFNVQSSFIVRSEITGPVSLNTADTIMAVLDPGSSMQVITNSLFNPTTPGTYTVKVWTQLMGDLENGNDTATYIFTVTEPSAVNASVNGLIFNGTNQYVEASGIGSLNIAGNQLTLEAWVSRNAGPGNAYIISKDSNSFNAQYSLYINPTGVLVFKTSTFMGPDSVESTETVPTGAYVHVAAAYNGLTMDLYINGKHVGSKSLFGTIIQNVQPVFVGRSGHSNGFFGGSIDEVRIWDTCRTTEQIRTSMHQRLANASSPYLKGYYRLDEVESTTFLIDASGNCNTGTLNNSPILAASNLSLGTPVTAHQSAAFSGPYTFAGTNIGMDIYNQVGLNEIYVHRFTTPMIGTSPVVSPGGVTAVYGNYWLAYRYGAGTMDSTNITYTVAGINSGAAVGDFNLFTRANTGSTAWTLAEASAQSVNVPGQSVTFTIDSLSFNQQMSVGANTHPLAVSLTSFAGSAIRTDAVLRWTTSSETNNKGFSVERSVDGKRFSEIGFVKGAGTSNRVNTYSYADKNIFAVQRAAYYRLKQVDLDGAFTYTNAVLVAAGQESKTAVTVYPNPVREELNIELESAHTAAVQINITDITGKLVKTINGNLGEGFNKLSISQLNTIGAGVYIINITSEGVVLYNNKLVKAE